MGLRMATDVRRKSPTKRLRLERGVSSVCLVAAMLGALFMQASATAGINDFNVGPETTVLPSFATSGKTFRIVTDDTVVLPCEVNNPGSFVLAWKRGIAVLTAGSVKVTPDNRIRLVDGYNLEIREVQTQDAGDYVCQIGTLEPREITHTVEILVPPQIKHRSSGGIVEVKKGSTVTLECKATGNPVPTITWTRKNNILPSGEQSVEGFSYTIDQANRHQGGTYLCSASNGVGMPVTQTITLNVLYPPEIELERSWVHSGEGYEAELVCIVHSEPSAEMVWYRDTLRLDTTERRIMEVRGSRHTLILRKVQASDFGNYSCVADNNLGRTRQYLELSGKPNPAIFRSHPMGRYRDSYNITWAVDSRTPIEEFKLYFRRQPVPTPQALPGGTQHQGQNQHARRPARRDNDTYGYMGGMGHIRNDWNDVILPAIPNSQFTQRMSYLIRGLDPAAQYEAKVQARNRFGWNVISERFQFSTRGTENSLYEPSPEPAVFADPEVRDLGMTAYNTASSTTCILAPVLALASYLTVTCS